MTEDQRDDKARWIAAVLAGAPELTEAQLGLIRRVLNQQTSDANPVSDAASAA
ncbi:MAG: hypothetical protein ACRDJC_25490 [Thermomicrobiales bacterium]